MNVKQFFQAVLDGQLSQDEVESWINQNTVAFEKPKLDNLTELDRKEGDRLINLYADWEIRIHDLSRAAAEASQEYFGLVESSPEFAVRIAHALKLVSKLLHNPQAEALGTFQYGFALWKAARYFDAADALAEAADSFQRSNSEPIMELSALSYLSISGISTRKFMLHHSFEPDLNSSISQP